MTFGIPSMWSDLAFFSAPFIYAVFEPYHNIASTPAPAPTPALNTTPYTNATSWINTIPDEPIISDLELLVGPSLKSLFEFLSQVGLWAFIFLPALYFMLKQIHQLQKQIQFLQEELLNLKQSQKRIVALMIQEIDQARQWANKHECRARQGRRRSKDKSETKTKSKRHNNDWFHDIKDEDLKVLPFFEDSRTPRTRTSPRTSRRTPPRFPRTRVGVREE